MIKIASSIVLALTALSPAPLADNRPNILLIVADDLGYADVGFNGLADFTTPNIDQFAEQGIRFTNGYASHSFCAPTRAGLMAGRYQSRFGFEGNPQSGARRSKSPDHGLPSSEECLAETLAAANYRTALIGKWHLGELDQHHPLRHGFQHFFGFLGGLSNYFKTDLSWQSLSSDGALVETPPSRTSRKSYLTDLFTDEATSFITQEKRANTSPWFLYLAFNAPHTPMQASDEWLAKVSNIPSENRRIYAAMVTALDDGIGRVLKSLERSGQRDNTLVFFFSDNGGITPVNAASNAPFRGLKGTLLEGGIRVPYIISWPRALPKGSTYDFPVMTFDAWATAISAAETHPLDTSIQRDSVNLLPYLRGQIRAEPHSHLFWRMGNGFQIAARSGGDKLFRVEGLPDRVFDLNSDIDETRPQPVDDQRSELRYALEAWTAELPHTDFTSTGLRHREQWEAVGLNQAPDREN